MPKARARSATRRPIAPRPTIPSRLPRRSRPSMKSIPQAQGSPERTSRSASPSRRGGAEDQRQRQVGGGVVEHAGGVGDGDTAAGGGPEVDVVVADGDVGDAAQLRAGGVEELVVDAIVQQGEHGVGAGDQPQQLSRVATAHRTRRPRPRRRLAAAPAPSPARVPVTTNRGEAAPASRFDSKAMSGRRLAPMSEAIEEGFKEGDKVWVAGRRRQAPPRDLRRQQRSRRLVRRRPQRLRRPPRGPPGRGRLDLPHHPPRRVTPSAMSISVALVRRRGRGRIRSAQLTRQGAIRCDS